MKKEIKIGKLKLKNPVSLASGTCAYGEELNGIYDLSSLGCIFTKGLSLNPRAGNEGNRIVETDSGILNSIGLENVGLESFIKNKIPYLTENSITYVPNAAGHSIEDNIEICERLSEIDSVRAVELNVSCPNVKAGGMAFGQNVKVLEKFLKQLRPRMSASLIVKLSPNVTDITEFAKCAEACGADAVSAVNTLQGMRIDIKTGKPYFNNTFAGLSGPAIKPVALRLVYQIYQSVKIPVIGLGGIKDTGDAIEFMMAGASAVQIGTMNLVYPETGRIISEGIDSYMKENKIEDINDIIGLTHRLKGEL
ncbi:MAG: dihydroorotate dehydrogenase [Spirochaetes bacterium]|nr:dihydroorotate dehydrogenase [Spirochaetota bacterium]